MGKSKKISVKSWVQFNGGPEFGGNFEKVVAEFILSHGNHPNIDFFGTPLEFANAVYTEWATRSDPRFFAPGLYPTPRGVALDMAKSLKLEDQDVVLDLGCGFGNLSAAIFEVNPSVAVIAVESHATVYRIASDIYKTLGSLNESMVLQADFEGNFGPFTKVIVNPPFGNIDGHPYMDLDFMERIAKTAPKGTLVAALLPETFFTKTRPMRYENIRKGYYKVLEKVELPESEFKPIKYVLHLVRVLLETTGTEIYEDEPGPVRPEVVASVKKSLQENAAVYQAMADSDTAPKQAPKNPADCAACGHPLSDHVETGQGAKRHLVCMYFGCKCGTGKY